MSVDSNFVDFSEFVFVYLYAVFVILGDLAVIEHHAVEFLLLGVFKQDELVDFDVAHVVHFGFGVFEVFDFLLEELQALVHGLGLTKFEDMSRHDFLEDVLFELVLYVHVEDAEEHPEVQVKEVLVEDEVSEELRAEHVESHLVVGVLLHLLVLI